MYNPIPNHVLLFNSYVNTYDDEFGDAVIATVKDKESLETRLHIIRNPMTQIYVTKKGLRNFKDKREYALLSELDQYIVPYKDTRNVLAKALGYKYAPRMKQLLNSPYVWGADVDPRIRMKIEYQNATPGLVPLSVGCFDLEVDVVHGTNEIIINSYCDWDTKTVYGFISGSWYDVKPGWEKTLHAAWNKEMIRFTGNLNEEAKKHFHPEEWTYKPTMCKNETELIIKSIRTMVLCRPNLCGAWNMNFDMPYITKRAQFRGIDLNKLFAHPDVPAEFRVFRYIPDRSKHLEHFTERWDAVQCPGYTYYYDPMCTYSRIRKVKGREISYSLDYISNLLLGAGKVTFGATDTHSTMQTRRKTDYVVYGGFDTILPCLLDKVTKDTEALRNAADSYMLEDYARQTVQLKAQFFNYCLQNGAVPGSVAGCQRTEIDNAIGNVGGAVLLPARMRSAGSRHLIESEDTTGIFRLCCDIDVSSFYPSLEQSCNISKETKEATVVWMDGCPYTIEELLAIEDEDEQKEQAVANAEYIFAFFAQTPTVHENAVSIGHEYFNLPNYTEMVDIYNKHQQEEESRRYVV